MVKDYPDEEEANDTFPEANGKHNSCDHHDVRDHARNMFKWVKQMIPENVDFVLEYLENLANRGHIEEKIDWSEQDLAQSSLYNVTAHVSLSSLDYQISELRQKYLQQSTEGSFVHKLSVQVLLLLWVYNRVLSIYTLNMIVEELLELSVDYK